MTAATTVDNVSEFLKWVENVSKRQFSVEEDDNWVPWFRGQAAAQLLCPKLYRGEYGGCAKLRKGKLEDEIREEFITRAPTLSEGVAPPDNDWGWYFLMQHFGTPTRLLDWTEGALVALYFAVKDNQGLFDAAVWALDPYALNETVIRKDEVLCPDSTGLTEREKNRIGQWLPRRFAGARLPEQPIAVFPTHTARRISTQRSGFTVHGRDPRGLDRMAERKIGCLAKVRIPSFRVLSIRKDLLMYGIDESTVFPDLDGLGRSLCLKYQCNSRGLPHEDVYTRLQRSDINGVGVFAIRRIKEGMRLFAGDNEEMLWVDEGRVPKRPRAICELYEDFAVIKGGRYGCPKNFNRLTMSWCINEPKDGESPNVRGDPETYDFWALRDIAPGEELTVNYDAYSERPVGHCEGPAKTGRTRRART